jgi:hypothetical protein
MKKVVSLFFVFAMILSVAFMGDAFSANAQTRTVTVKRKSNPGIIRSVGRGGKYVVRRTWDGTKYVSKKVWVGTKYAGKKTVQGTKYVGKKTWKGGRMVTSRAKKIIY